MTDPFAYVAQALAPAVFLVHTVHDQWSATVKKRWFISQTTHFGDVGLQEPCWLTSIQ